MIKTNLIIILLIFAIFNSYGQQAVNPLNKGNRANDPSIDNSISSPAECHDITIASGASITIPEGKALTVYGNITNNAGNAGIIIKSSATGDGSLIIKEGTTTNATIEKYYTAGEWHLITPPVSNATATVLYDANVDSWLSEHNESETGDDSWSYIIDITTPLTQSKGYAYWIDGSTAQIKTYTGTISGNNFSPNVYFTDASHGFNLVGNPYTCAIDWDEGTWTKTNLENSIWIWDNDYNGGDYRPWNGSTGDLSDGIIPEGQGFFVRANASSPALTIPADARVHDDQPFYKSRKKSELPELKLKVHTGNYANVVWITFPDEGTEQFDNGFDCSKLFGNLNASQIYSGTEEHPLSINAMPPLTANEDKIVPLKLKVAQNTAHKLEVLNINNLDDVKITLEDIKTGKLQELTENSVYVFDANINDDVNRFNVHFYYSPNAVDENIENNAGIKIYTYNNRLYIRSNENLATEPGTIKIYDLMGRLITSQHLENGTLLSIPLNINTGNYLVNVTRGNAVKTEKIFIR